MNTKTIKMVAMCLMVLAATINSYAQTNVKTTEVCGKKPIKIEKKKIPKVVTEPYYKEYPATLNENWYGHPTFIKRLRLVS